jgi:glycosyltransferase involved in cell wall biosynthesis
MMNLSTEEITRLAKEYWGREHECAEMLPLHGGVRSGEKKRIKTIAMMIVRLNHGGAERVVAELIDIFFSIGIQTVLITEREPSDDDYQPQAPFTRVVMPPRPNKGEDYPGRAEALLSIIEEHGVDLVINQFHLESIAFWDGLVFRSAGILSVLHNHAAFTYYLRINRLHDFLVQPYIRKPYNAQIALSRVDALYWGAFHDRVFIMSNPIAPALPSDAAIIKAASQAQNHKRLLWMSRLVPYNNYLDLIDIVDMIKAVYPDVEVQTFGAMSPDKTEQEIFLQRIQECGLEKNIILRGFATSVETAYSQASLLLFTADSGTWPMTIMEAMGFGVPTVAYDLPWIETLRVGKGIVISPFLDKRRFADHVIELLQDEDRLQQLGAEARDAHQTYQAIDHAQLWQGFFEELVGTREDDMDLFSEAAKHNVKSIWGKRIDSIGFDGDNAQNASIAIQTYARYLERCTG